MIGNKASERLGNNYRYIRINAEEIETTSHGACLKVLAETEKVLNQIIEPIESKLS
jgi:hypothetical protein